MRSSIWFAAGLCPGITAYGAVFCPEGIAAELRKLTASVLVDHLLLKQPPGFAESIPSSGLGRVTDAEVLTTGMCEARREIVCGEHGTGEAVVFRLPVTLLVSRIPPDGKRVELLTLEFQHAAWIGIPGISPGEAGPARGMVLGFRGENLSPAEESLRGFLRARYPWVKLQACWKEFLARPLGSLALAAVLGSPP